MSIKFAYLGIVIIWSTTPLVVQWSSDPYPLFSVMIRMTIGIIACFLFMLLYRKKITFNRQSLPVISVAGASIYLAMTLVYISATIIPSGWISVIYGMSPIVTGIIARYVLDEDNLSRTKITGMILGVVGLALVFASGLSFDQKAVWGIILCTLAMFVTSSCTVILKKINQYSQLSGMQTNLGGLVLSLPFFVLSWWFFELDIGDSNLTNNLSSNLNSISMRAYLSMIYLGIIATTLGFTLYYYLIKNISATRVSMIALITPVTALFLGSWLNNEPIVWTVWLGAALICSGLLLFELNLRDSWQSLRRYFRGV